MGVFRRRKPATCMARHQLVLPVQSHRALVNCTTMQSVRCRFTTIIWRRPARAILDTVIHKSTLSYCL